MLSVAARAQLGRFRGQCPLRARMTSVAGVLGVRRVRHGRQQGRLAGAVRVVAIGAASRAHLEVAMFAAECGILQVVATAAHVFHRRCEQPGALALMGLMALEAFTLLGRGVRECFAGSLHDVGVARAAQLGHRLGKQTGHHTFMAAVATLALSCEYRCVHQLALRRGARLHEIGVAFTAELTWLRAQ